MCPEKDPAWSINTPRVDTHTHTHTQCVSSGQKSDYSKQAPREQSWASMWFDIVANLCNYSHMTHTDPNTHFFYELMLWKMQLLHCLLTWNHWRRISAYTYMYNYCVLVCLAWNLDQEVLLESFLRGQYSASWKWPFITLWWMNAALTETWLWTFTRPITLTENMKEVEYWFVYRDHGPCRLTFKTLEKKLKIRHLHRNKSCFSSSCSNTTVWCRDLSVFRYVDMECFLHTETSDFMNLCTSLHHKGHTSLITAFDMRSMSSKSTSAQSHSYTPTSNVWSLFNTGSDTNQCYRYRCCTVTPHTVVCSAVKHIQWRQCSTTYGL